MMVKLDFKNAFNCVHRDFLLESANVDILKPISKFVRQCYAEPTHLLYGDSYISSETGVQQGDPLGPPLFCLALDQMVKSLQAPFNVWYLDDGTIGGSVEEVLAAVDAVVAFETCSGLALNPAKCEVYFLHFTEPQKQDALRLLNQRLPGILNVERPDLHLL
jgi:hypothetical protein